MEDAQPLGGSAKRRQLIALGKSCCTGQLTQESTCQPLPFGHRQQAEYEDQRLFWQLQKVQSAWSAHTAIR